MCGSLGWGVDFVRGFCCHEVRALGCWLLSDSRVYGVGFYGCLLGLFLC